MVVENRSEKGEFLSRPIILVGAGRSGSTLFTRMMNAHPEVQFLGETDFLIGRLWREVWDNRFWLNFANKMGAGTGSTREMPPEIPADIVDAARGRAARGVRHLFADLMELDPTHRVWGFKEIWNGAAVAQIPWSVYQTVFPGARWVHLVRDPFTFLRSLAAWNELPLTTKVIKVELKNWQRVVAWSRQLRDEPDFFEIRFEDLVASPEGTLAPILGVAGLSWHQDCARELDRRVLGSREQPPFVLEQTLEARQVAELVERTKGMAPLMEEFGYTAPERLEIHAPNDEIERALPGRVDLRSMTRVPYDFSLPDEPKKVPTGRRIRKAIKHFFRPSAFS